MPGEGHPWLSPAAEETTLRDSVPSGELAIEIKLSDSRTAGNLFEASIMA